jgi:hypothetical protein
VVGAEALPVSGVEEKVTGQGTAPTKTLTRTQIKLANRFLLGQVQVLHWGLVQVLVHASIVARLVTGHVIVLPKVTVSESDFVCC